MYAPDEVAGIVDLFDALTREETQTALSELAYRRGEEPPENAVDDAIDAFALVEFDHEGERVVAPGPAAFPTLPEGAEDLPHILETDGRTVGRDAIVAAAVSRFRADVDRTVEETDDERAAELLEISYDLEAWGGPDLSEARDALDTVRDGTNY